MECFGIGFVKIKNDQGVYFLNSKHDKVIVSVCVEYLIITFVSEIKVEEVKMKMMRIFDMTNIGLWSFYLGMEKHQGGPQIILS